MRRGINEASFRKDRPTRGSSFFCYFSCKRLDWGRRSSQYEAKTGESALVCGKLSRIVQELYCLPIKT